MLDPTPFPRRRTFVRRPPVRHRAPRLGPQPAVIVIASGAGIIAVILAVAVGFPGLFL